jgi:geranylgeranyl diphosphate synthase type I
MSLESFACIFRPAVESILRSIVDQTRGPGLDKLHHMLTYHMGWEGEGAGPDACGKRLRPLLVLLVNCAGSGNWESALPAAASVELIHNFSLVHDDIQDQSILRRGRPTVWHLWGAAQAINAGDTLFTMAFIALRDLQKTCSPIIVQKAGEILQEACLALTQGQYLDMSYEKQPDISLDSYWPMISGKTAALLRACTGLGALTSRVRKGVYEAYRRFGYFLGLAYQIQDDLLGLWGDEAVLGKSVESDLITAKKTLPVLYGLSLNGKFAHRWRKGSITPEEVSSIARQLEDEGGRAYTVQQVNRLTYQALESLQEAYPEGDAGDALRELAEKLITRSA